MKLHFRVIADDPGTRVRTPSVRIRYSARMGIKTIKGSSVVVKTTRLDSKPTTRRDSWENAITGLNVLGQDKRLASFPVLCPIGWDQAEILWRCDDMAARIIEAVPYEETREGFELVADEEGGDEEETGEDPELDNEEEDAPAGDVPAKDPVAFGGQHVDRFDADGRPKTPEQIKEEIAALQLELKQVESGAPAKPEGTPAAAGAPASKEGEPVESSSPFGAKPAAEGPSASKEGEKPAPGQPPAAKEGEKPAAEGASPFGAKPEAGGEPPEAGGKPPEAGGKPPEAGEEEDPLEETELPLGVPAPPKEDDSLEQLQEALDELGVLDKLYEARTYARAYGGGAWLLGVDDGERDMSKPLNPDNVKSFDWINVLHPRELAPASWYGDATAPKYGEVETYFLSPENRTGTSSLPGLLLVHESRIVRFEGVVVSKRQRQQGAQQGWGDSVLTRVYDVVRDFQSTWQATGVLMQDFAQTIFKMKGLAELVSSEDPDDQLRFRNRVKAADYSRSVLNSVIIDADGEDFERKTTAVTGLPDVLDKFAVRLAAAARMPVTKLMGQSASGLNATGDNDVRNWYDEVRSDQVRKLSPVILRVGKLKASAMGLKLPDKWEPRWKPLWQLDESEEATRRKTIVDMAVAAVGAGMITPEEAAVSLFGGKQFSADIKLATKERSAFAEERKAADAEAAEMNLEVAKAGAKAGGGKPGFGGKPGGGGGFGAKKPFMGKKPGGFGK